MPEIGAQIDDLARLQSQFNQQSTTVDSLTSSIGTELSSAYWKGPAADRFRDSWTSSFEPTLRQLQAALQDSAQEIAMRQQALVDAGG